MLTLLIGEMFSFVSSAHLANKLILSIESNTFDNLISSGYLLLSLISRSIIADINFKLNNLFFTSYSIDVSTADLYTAASIAAYT